MSITKNDIVQGKKIEDSDNVWQKIDIVNPNFAIFEESVDNFGRSDWMISNRCICGSMC